VKQRGTYRHSFVSNKTGHRCYQRTAMRPGASLGEIGRIALICSEIAIDAGEQGADSWEIAALIRQRFALEAK